MNLVKQRIVEIRYHKATLKQEFSHWRARTQPNQPPEQRPLEKQHSQMARVTAQLEGFLDAVSEPDEQAANAFAESARAYKRLLFAHRVWAYFRSKFGLREVEALRNELKCADELAWACYQPARDKAEQTGFIAANALKEPPLVFFATDATPYMQGRTTLFDFEAEGITADDITAFGQALLKLPIPVIAMPWFQVNHLPSAVLIAHEVGHAVERDFGLQQPLSALFQQLNIPEARKAAWLAWRQEIFADLYGVLCTGPAFVLALIDYLADVPEIIQTERLSAPPWGAYPTRSLRMLCNFEVLRQLGLDDAGAGAAWQSTYPVHAMPEFAPDDVKAVVSQLLQASWAAFGNVDLRQVIHFSADDWQKTQNVVFRVNQGFPLPKGEPFTRLFAAATVAYHADPVAYTQQNAQRGVIEAILAAIKPGVRDMELALTPKAVADRQQADRQAGRDLLTLLVE